MNVRRSGHRFFLPGCAPAADGTLDLDAIAHQLHHVLRLPPGTEITVLDGSGEAFATRLAALDGRRATGEVTGRRPAQREPETALTLLQCMLKRDRFEWVLQKGTELGVARFVPVISGRTVVRPAARLMPKYERWRAIIREAAEQSGRGRLPMLDEPAQWRDALEAAAGRRLLFLEGQPAGDSSGLSLPPGTPQVAALIGPEGGISREEASAAAAMGWTPVSLGPRTLRAETAAIAATTIILHKTGSLG